MLLQDGGDGQIGRVIDVRGWDDESARSVANVEWSSGSTNVYRLGHKGKVDLRVVHSTVGGSYFREALPVVSIMSAHSEVSVRIVRVLDNLPRVADIVYSVGDKVKITVASDRLREMQEGRIVKRIFVIIILKTLTRL